MCGRIHGQQSPAEWTIRQARPEDRDATLALLGRAFGRDAPSLRWWNWALLENPADAGPYSLVAQAGDRLVGQWACVPMRLQHHHGAVLGLRGVYLATDPDYRGRGILTALGRRIDREFGADAAMSFGFANTSSRSVLLRVGSVELRPYPRLIRPVAGLAREANAWRRWAVPAGLAGQFAFDGLAAAHSVSVRLSGTAGRRVEAFETFGPWADRLWEELSPRLGTCVRRDAAYLDWRFRAAPYDYRRIALSGSRGPEGFAVTRTVRGRGGRMIVELKELMVRPDDHQGARALIDRVVRDARAERAAGVVTLATRRHPFRRELMRAGFLPVRRPGNGYSFTARILGRDHDLVPNEIFHIDDWYLSGADLLDR